MGHSLSSVLGVALFLTLAPAAAMHRPPDAEYYYPPEWAEQSAVHLGWPPEVYMSKQDYSKYMLKNATLPGRTNKDVVVTITCAIAGAGTNVSIAVNDEAEHAEASAMLHAGCAESMGLVSFIRIPHTDSWWRDMGPPFLLSRSDPAATAILDVSFHYWGYVRQGAPYWELTSKDDNVDRLYAMAMAMATSTHTDLYHEGGNTEVDGQGRLMAVRAVELQRNPNSTLEEIGAKLAASYLGTRGQTIFLEQGMMDDELPWTGPFDFGTGEPVYTFGTGGHVDEVARFAPGGKVLLPLVTEEEAKRGPAMAENRRRMLANRAILEEAGLEVIDVPAAPDLFYAVPPSSKPGSTYASLASYTSACDPELPYTLCRPFPAGETISMAVASSYQNYLVSNGHVFMQKYCLPGIATEEICAKDLGAQAAIQAAYPGYKIVPLDILAVNLGGGGIHCYTMQQPKPQAVAQAPSASSSRLPKPFQFMWSGLRRFK